MHVFTGFSRSFSSPNHSSPIPFLFKVTMKYLGRSARAFREMYYNGKILCVRDGRRMLFDFDIVDLGFWIEKNKTQLTY
jgi:hypothetical protein